MVEKMAFKIETSTQSNECRNGEGTRLPVKCAFDVPVVVLEVLWFGQLPQTPSTSPNKLTLAATLSFACVKLTNWDIEAR